MSTDVINASKSAGILRLDHLLEHPAPAHRQLLIDQPDVFTVMKDQSIVMAGDAAHMNDDIFGSAFWPDAPANKADILRAAYIKAIELATEPLPAAPAKPIVTYHIKGLAKDVFEVAVAATVHEVHILWMTPHAPMPSTPPGTLPPLQEQDLWLVGSSERLAAVRARYPGLGYPGSQIPAAESVADIDGVAVMNCPTY